MISSKTQLPQQQVGKTYIYALKDPRDGQIRYIGKANNPRQRYTQHLRERKNTYKCHWIRGLAEIELYPEMVIIDFIDNSEWCEKEKYWIAYYKEKGFKLCNISKGGGLTEHSEETRLKIAAAHMKPRPNMYVKYAQYNIYGEYITTHISAQHAGKALGTTSGAITEANRKSHLCGEFYWRRVGETPPTLTIAVPKRNAKGNVKFDRPAPKKNLVQKRAIPWSQATTERMQLLSRGANNGNSSEYVVLDNTGVMIGSWKTQKSTACALGISISLLEKRINGSTRCTNGYSYRVTKKSPTSLPGTRGYRLTSKAENWGMTSFSRSKRPVLI